MAKLVTEAVNATYKYYIGALAEDMGRDIVVKIRAGHNPAIPWDDENDEPIDSSAYPDESDWYVYTTYNIQHVLLIYPDDYATFMSAGIFDSQDVKIMCKLEDVLIDAATPTGQTIFELDGLDYITIEGYNYIRKGVVKKTGLTDLYLCEVVLTRRME